MTTGAEANSGHVEELHDGENIFDFRKKFLPVGRYKANLVGIRSAGKLDRIPGVATHEVCWACIFSSVHSGLAQRCLIGCLRSASYLVPCWLACFGDGKSCFRRMLARLHCTDLVTADLQKIWAVLFVLLRLPLLPPPARTPLLRLRVALRARLSARPPRPSLCSAFA